MWVSDITYVPTDEGWLYLAGHKNLSTSEIVGYAVEERLTHNLVKQSLLRAVTTGRPEEGLLHHSDRGSQYCSHEYQGLLKQFGLEASMSGSRNCFDSAEVFYNRQRRPAKLGYLSPAAYAQKYYAGLVAVL